jgi:hypothetical protein
MNEKDAKRPYSSAYISQLSHFTEFSNDFIGDTENPFSWKQLKTPKIQLLGDKLAL